MVKAILVSWVDSNHKLSRLALCNHSYPRLVFGTRTTWECVLNSLEMNLKVSCDNKNKELRRDFHLETQRGQLLCDCLKVRQRYYVNARHLRTTPLCLTTYNRHLESLMKMACNPLPLLCNFIATSLRTVAIKRVIKSFNCGFKFRDITCDVPTVVSLRAKAVTTCLFPQKPKSASGSGFDARETPGKEQI